MKVVPTTDPITVSNFLTKAMSELGYLFVDQKYEQMGHSVYNSVGILNHADRGH
jgi:hypothetical protein